MKDGMAGEGGGGLFEEREECQESTAEELTPQSSKE